MQDEMLALSILTRWKMVEDIPLPVNRLKRITPRLKVDRESIKYVGEINVWCHAVFSSTMAFLSYPMSSIFLARWCRTDMV
jgi:hypothetical protein